MPTAISRMQLLRGDLRGRSSPVRPPWSLPEHEFVEFCDSCGECIQICPEKILRPGRAGFPEADFSIGGCTFCGDCVKTCAPGALKFGDDPSDRPWAYRAEISRSCLSVKGVVCRSCGEACDDQAIRFKLEPKGVALPLIDSETCTGCGFCIPVCPVQAVTVYSRGAGESEACA